MKMIRKLYLIPVIHMSADMGSVAPALDGRATAELGQELWRKHKETVSGFWDSVGRFLDSLNVTGFKIYQDGLVANGAEGLRIVTEGISLGSKNYKIVGKLLKRGAVLVQTEDFALVKQEHSHIMKMTQSKSVKGKKVAALRYKLVQAKLLRQRDDFIARRINETLPKGETGILFIGAYHDILPRLATDIRVIQVKEIAKVKDYHKSLIGKRRYDQHLQELTEYLISPVSEIPF